MDTDRGLCAGHRAEEAQLAGGGCAGAEWAAFKPLLGRHGWLKVQRPVASRAARFQNQPHVMPLDRMPCPATPPSLHRPQCRYVPEYLAIGEAPEEVRNCFQQRSRWSKGHFQVGAAGGGGGGRRRGARSGVKASRTWQHRCLEAWQRLAGGAQTARPAPFSGCLCRLHPFDPPIPPPPPRSSSRGTTPSLRGGCPR